MKQLIIKDLGLIPYQQAYDLQKKTVKAVKQGETDHLFLCEHPNVLTMGRMYKDANLLFPPEEIAAKKVELCSIDRGGDITLHAPGQLVVYPILNLANQGKDLRVYLRKLEQVVIAVLRQYGIESTGSDDQRGVWVGKDKIASMGIGVSKWVCYHGVGLNVSTDLDLFKLIRPCGLDVQMTSLEKALNKTIDITEVKTYFIEHFSRQFDCAVMEEQ